MKRLVKAIGSIIELHYGHLQPAQKTNVIAGKRMGSKKKVVGEAQVAFLMATSMLGVGSRKLRKQWKLFL